MSRPKLRLFPRPGDVHLGVDSSVDPRFSSTPDQTGVGAQPRNRQQRRKEDAQADEASRESFPASDPPATY